MNCEDLNASLLRQKRIFCLNSYNVYQFINKIDNSYSFKMHYFIQNLVKSIALIISQQYLLKFLH